MLKIGSIGVNVEELQKDLKITADGIFGPETEKAVKAFQLSLGLNPDGIVGALTSAALLKISGISHELVKGLDIYHGDVVKNWADIVLAGYSFIYIKASQGLSGDPKFAEYNQHAQAAGLITGAYHFIGLSGDPVDQARYFANILKENDYDSDLDLPPVLDWEYGSTQPKLSDATWARKFLGELTSLLSVIPMIYMSASLPDEIGNPLWLTRYPLWVAEYGVSAPKLRSPYNDWQFWQKAENAIIPGLANTGDTNVFNGNIDTLKTFIKGLKL